MSTTKLSERLTELAIATRDHHAIQPIREMAAMAEQLEVRVEYLEGRWFVPFASQVREQREAMQVCADALGRISKSSNWYANNGARLPHEVDHALCVEIPSESDAALSSLKALGITPKP